MLELNQITLASFASLGVLSTLTIALVAAIKSTNYVNNRYNSVLPVIVGVALAFLVMGFGKLPLLVGMVIGLVAAGLYDQKNVVA